jgi:RNA methyltransferase, TrmH family
MNPEVMSYPVLGKHSPRLQRLRRIVAREVPALTVLDGMKLIGDAAAGGARIVEVYGVASQLSALSVSSWFVELARRGAVAEIDGAVAQRVAPTRSPQGVLAVVEVPSATISAAGVAVYLADVQDPGNVGGIVRSAAAFGATGVACSPGCADPFSPRALRASAGMSLLMPVATIEDFAALALAFRAAGGTVASTAGDHGVPLRRWRPVQPLLVVFGNEGHGIPFDVREHCDSVVSVPIAARVESLNVAVTAGIVLHALAGVAKPPILD